MLNSLKQQTEICTPRMLNTFNFNSKIQQPQYVTPRNKNSTTRLQKGIIPQLSNPKKISQKHKMMEIMSIKKNKEPLITRQDIDFKTFRCKDITSESKKGQFRWKISNLKMFLNFKNKVKSVEQRYHSTHKLNIVKVKHNLDM